MEPLATPTDLEARLGRDLTLEETARADALLADASALVRGYTRQQFTAVADDVIVLRPVGAVLRLPQRPVTAVVSLAAVGPDGGTVGALSGWVWDGRDKVDLTCAGPSGSWPLNWSGPLPDTYQVTYSHGQATAPADVLAVVCRMVLRTLTAPTVAGSVTGETMGPYSYRTDGSGAGTAVAMTGEDRAQLTAGGYRRAAGTTQVRAL